MINRFSGDRASALGSMPSRRLLIARPRAPKYVWATSAENVSSRTVPSVRLTRKLRPCQPYIIVSLLYRLQLHERQIKVGESDARQIQGRAWISSLLQPQGTRIARLRPARPGPARHAGHSPER